MATISTAPLEADLSGAYSTELRLTTEGRIVDFLRPDVSRPNTPEERVRQVFARKLHFDYGYPKSVMGIEAPVHILGWNDARLTSWSFKTRLRPKYATRARSGSSLRPRHRMLGGVSSSFNHIFASSAEGGVWINETDAPKYYRRIDGRLKDWPNLPRYGELWDSVGLIRSGRSGLLTTSWRPSGAATMPSIDRVSIPKTSPWTWCE